MAELPLVTDWASLGRPVIVRRYLEGENARHVPAALSLPPCHGKQRVAISLPPDAGITERAAVSLAEAAAAAPADWQPTIAALVDLGAILDDPPRVFGALLWQQVTGLTYLSDGSDLDLLWAPMDETRLDALLTGLDAIDARSPMRLDGEIELPDGAGVAWRELAEEARGGNVLAKTLLGVETRSRARLFDSAATIA